MSGISAWLLPQRTQRWQRAHAANKMPSSAFKRKALLTGNMGRGKDYGKQASENLDGRWLGDTRNFSLSMDRLIGKLLKKQCQATNNLSSTHLSDFQQFLCFLQKAARPPASWWNETITGIPNLAWPEDMFFLIDLISFSWLVGKKE